MCVSVDVCVWRGPRGDRRGVFLPCEVFLVRPHFNNL